MDLDPIREILGGLGAGEGDELGQPLELVGEEAGDRRGGAAEPVGLDGDRSASDGAPPAIGRAAGPARRGPAPPRRRPGRPARARPIPGGGGRQVGQRGAGRRVVQDDRPRVIVVFLGAEEGGQGDEIGPDEAGPIDKE